MIVSIFIDVSKRENNSFHDSNIENFIEVGLELQKLQIYLGN